MARSFGSKDLVDDWGPSDLLNPFRAARIVDLLGWLAPWWLRQNVIELASQYQPAYAAYAARPSLPCVPGDCWVMLVHRRNLTVLREACLLPLRWEGSADDDPYLPRPLLELAERIRQQLEVSPNSRWGLRLAAPPGEEPIDCSTLEGDVLGVASAWASLTGGLLLAQDGLSPDRSVWASVAWDPTYGVGQVDGVAAKLNLAAEWGVKQVFLPAQNQPQVSDWQLTNNFRGSIELLSPANRDPVARRVLEPYLKRLGIEPGVEASFEVYNRYYLRVDRGRADAFYWKRLMESDIRQCRETVPDDCRPTHLVTVVSLAPAVVVMAAAALKVRNCLLLHEGKLEGEIKEAYGQVWDYLTALEIACQPSQLDGETIADVKRRVQQAMERFAVGVPANELAFELTPGFKSLSLALAAAAPPGAWLLYCRHRQVGFDKRPMPGSQKYECWRKDA